MKSAHKIICAFPCFIHNNQTVELAMMFLDRWVFKMFHTNIYNGITSCHKNSNNLWPLPKKRMEIELVWMMKTPEMLVNTKIHVFLGHWLIHDPQNACAFNFIKMYSAVTYVIIQNLSLQHMFFTTWSMGLVIETAMSHKPRKFKSFQWNDLGKH